MITKDNPGFFTRVKNKLSEKYVFNAVFVGLAFAVSVVFVLSGSYVSAGYNIRPGTVSQRRIISPQEAIDVVATEALRNQAAERVLSNPIYKQDNGVTQTALDRLDRFFGEIEELRRLHNPISDPTAEIREPVAVEDLDRSNLSLDVSVTSQFQFLVTSESSVFISFRGTIRLMTEERLTSGIKEDALYSVSLAVKDELSAITEWDTAVKNTGNNIITQVLKPNIFVDEENMEKAAQEARDAVEPVIIQRGQNIVDEGEPITPEVYAILESLGLLSSGVMERLPAAVGAILTVAATFAAGLLFLADVYKNIVSDKKNVALLFTLYSLSILAAWLLQGMSFVFAPVILFTMLTAVLLNEGLAAGFSICVSVVTSVIYRGDIKFVTFFIVCGLFSALVAKLITERNKMLSVTAMISGFNGITVCAVFLVANGGVTAEMIDTAVMAALYGMFSVVICMGVLPFFETAFGFVTVLKLVDLANPNNPLLRRLIIEAPGTYHHCLIVSNLAETACYSIGANHTLARVGGYYHDIGKIKYPQYFIENLAGAPNPHDDMDPQESARIIIEHVSYGLELAISHKLPKPVRTFIEEHHGQSVQTYFLHKAKTLAEKTGKTVDESDFRYNYSVPRSRESAVIMLADIVEAAVRSAMPSGSEPEKLRGFIADLVNKNFNDGRLIHSGLTIDNLETIIDAFIRVFKGMHHERVKYPSMADPPVKPGVKPGVKVIPAVSPEKSAKTKKAAAAKDSHKTPPNKSEVTAALAQTVNEIASDTAKESVSELVNKAAGGSEKEVNEKEEI